MNLEIPCYVRNRQGECLWLHDGKVIGNIQDKYSFQRTPINGSFFVFWQKFIVIIIIFLF